MTILIANNFHCEDYNDFLFNEDGLRVNMNNFYKKIDADRDNRRANMDTDREERRRTRDESRDSRRASGECFYNGCSPDSEEIENSFIRGQGRGRGRNLGRGLGRGQGRGLRRALGRGLPEDSLHENFENGDTKNIANKEINFNFDEKENYITISFLLPNFILESDVIAKNNKDNVCIEIEKNGFESQILIDEEGYSAEAYFVKNIKDGEGNCFALSSSSQSITQSRGFNKNVDLNNIEISFKKNSNKLIINLHCIDGNHKNNSNIPIKILES
jgi:hypothetical protein